MTLLFPINVGTVSTMKDRGMKITIYAPELSHDKAAELLSMTNKEGIAAFSLSEISSDLLKEVDASVNDFGPSGKTPSERLRNVLYALWTHNKGVESFEMFYKRKMEDFITTIKAQINETGF